MPENNVTMKWIWVLLTGAVVLVAAFYAVLALVRKWLHAPSSDLNRIYDSTML